MFSSIKYKNKNPEQFNPEKIQQDSITLTILKKQNVSYFEYSLDPDQLASEKPADQDPHCFLLYNDMDTLWMKNSVHPDLNLHHFLKEGIGFQALR